MFQLCSLKLLIVVFLNCKWVSSGVQFFPMCSGEFLIFYVSSSSPVSLHGPVILISELPVFDHAVCLLYYLWCFQPKTIIVYFGVAMLAWLGSRRFAIYYVHASILSYHASGTYSIPAFPACSYDHDPLLILAASVHDFAHRLSSWYFLCHEFEYGVTKSRFIILPLCNLYSLVLCYSYVITMCLICSHYMFSMLLVCLYDIRTMFLIC